MVFFIGDIVIFFHKNDMFLIRVKKDIENIFY